MGLVGGFSLRGGNGASPSASRPGSSMQMPLHRGVPIEPSIGTTLGSTLGGASRLPPSLMLTGASGTAAAARGAHAVGSGVSSGARPLLYAAAALAATGAGASGGSDATNRSSAASSHGLSSAAGVGFSAATLASGATLAAHGSQVWSGGPPGPARLFSVDGLTVDGRGLSVQLGVKASRRGSAALA